MKPSRIIIGSSNIYRHCGKAAKDRGYNVINCTKFELFKVRVMCLEEVDKAVIVCAIEIFVCDAVESVDKTDSDALGTAIDKIMDDFIDVVTELANKFKQSRFALVPPTRRPVHPWYTLNFEMMTLVYREKILARKLSNLTVTNGCSAALEVF